VGEAVGEAAATEEQTTPVADTQTEDAQPEGQIADDQSGEQTPETEEAIPAALMAEAQAYGLSAEVAKGMDATQLEAVLTTMDRQLVQANQTKPETAPEAKPPAKPEPEQAAEPFKFDWPTDPENQVAEPVRKQMEKLAEHITTQKNAEIEGLRKELADVRAQQQAVEDREVARAFDAWREQVPDEWKAKLGSGPLAKLRTHSPARKASLDVFHAADRLADVFPGLGPSELFSKAYRAVFDKEADAVARRKGAEAAAKGRRGTTNRARDGKGRLVNKEQEHLERISRAYEAGKAIEMPDR
jgi:hypothetical protein